MHTCIVEIPTCFQRETTASENCQKLSKLFPCQSYSGSCGIKTSTTLSNKVTEVAKDSIFSISSPLISTGSMSGMVVYDTYPLHFLGLFRGLLTFEQCLCTQKSQTRHLIELNPKHFLHTPQGNLLGSTGLGALCELSMTFVLPTFTCRPFDSKLVFQTRNCFYNSSTVSAIMTRSSA